MLANSYDRDMIKLIQLNGCEFLGYWVFQIFIADPVKWDACFLNAIRVHLTTPIRSM